MGILILFILISAKFDAILINGGHYIDSHISRFIFRGLIIFLIPGNFIAYGLIFSSLFDPMLNYFRGLDFWYLGTVSKWDIFFTKHKTAYKILRFVSLGLGLFIYFKF